MKKKLLSLLLALCLVMALVPMTAFAEENEQSNKTSITTVDELLQFAKAVDNGEYDDKTDAVVSLDADLDLTGVAWTPIGSVFAADGTLLHYFSGKFYGNGHTISNLDFSENYGKTEYPSFGFFSEVYGAEISGLTIQGKLDVSNSGYVYFGTVAGVAADSKISDCASDVSFTDTDKYINGTVALCGYAINSTIEYCQNKGNFSITKDVSSFQMGGIVGLAQNSTVQYCANTGDMTSWTPCTGGIVGQLFQNSKIINCYSTGKMVPLGNGITDFGGIAGIVGAGTEIRHCYFAGEMDLSQYTATTPHKRLGGIAGGVSSDTPVFENNYFVENENVPACFKYQDAGTEKTLDFMKTEDFFNEITAAGGNYRINSNGTPLLPAPKYAVSFVITPAVLANVVIKVNGQAVANPADLEAGTYAVEVSADNCEVFNLNITITADTATHTQTIAMTYLPADYTKVDEAIAKANALNKDNYKDFSAVETAVNAVVRDKNITEQTEVDAMAKAIEDAIAALQYKDADYTKVDAAIAKANALNKDNYKDFTGVEAAVNAVVRDKNITEQSEVDAMAKAIEDAIAALQYKDADYTKVDAAIAKANALKKDDYKDFSGVETAVKAVVRGKNITEQSEVDKMAKAIEDAIAALEKKPASTKPGTSDRNPQTGDTSNLALWIALLFVSGGAVTVTAVYGRKKKHSVK
ncbi:The GLUG motif [uncultured Clostridium sp.]|nr:The GLUG motif [uncultured Clostridium sp.]